MTAWRWAVGPWRAGVSAKGGSAEAGGPQVELGTATVRTLRAKLLEPSEASFTVVGSSPEAAMLEELITDLWVWRDGTALFRGRVTGTRDNLAGGQHTTAVDARDYRQVLDRRILLNDWTWTGVEQSVIAWDLISEAQSRLGGNLGLIKGVWPVTGVSRPSVIAKTGDTVWSTLKTIAAMDGGFQLDIDADLAVNLYYPQRGADDGVVCDHGGVVESMDRTFEPTLFANAVRQSGADGVAATVVTTPDLDSAPEGRWDAQFSDTQLTTVDMVAQTAAANLGRASLPYPVYGLKLRRGAWGGPAHVWLGDYVLVAVRSGRLNEVSKVRVYQVDISVDASDVEDVTIVAGDVRLDPRSVLRGIARRVAYLSKR